MQSTVGQSTLEDQGRLLRRLLSMLVGFKRLSNEIIGNQTQ